MAIDPAKVVAEMAKTGVSAGDVGAWVKSRTGLDTSQVRDLATRYGRAIEGIGIAPSDRGKEGVQSALAQFQASAGQQFEAHSRSAVDKARSLSSLIVSNGVKSLGVPPGLIAPFVTQAQDSLLAGAKSAVSGLAAEVLGPAVAGLAGPAAGIVGPLLSMGIGALFGEKRNPPPPPPPKQRTITAKNLGQIDPLRVINELWYASWRWHSNLMGRASGAAAVYAADFGLTAEDLRGLPAAGSKLAVGTLPAAHTARFRLVQDGRIVPGRTGRIQKPLEHAGFGAPIPWKTEGEGDEYRFTHDALGEFLGYNQTLSFAVAERIRETFAKGSNLPHLAPFAPYLGEIGWAEFIVASALLQAGTNNNLETLNQHGGMANFEGRQVSKWLVGAYAKSIFPDVNALADPTKGGTAYLRRLGAKPLNSGLGALAFVTAEIRTAQALRKDLAGRGEESLTSAKGAVEELKTWLKGELDRIHAALEKIGAKVERIEALSAANAATTGKIEKQLGVLLWGGGALLTLGAAGTGYYLWRRSKGRAAA